MTIKLKKLLSLVLCVICIVSTFPVMAFSTADDGTEIIFAIDTSSDMLKYNLGVDSTLADALTGITEQTPQGCTFGVVTKDNITPPSDVETATQALYDIRNYYGSSNISDVVDNALETFSGTGNRVLFIVTDKWDSVKDKINNLNSDTTAYIICFETDDSKSESIKSECSNAVVCSNARELTYKLADVYEQMLYLPVVSGGTRLMSNSSNGYNSSFRYGKHNYGTSVSSNQKVINGRGDNIFDPEANATITEYLAMTVRAADMSKPNISGISSGSEWTYPDDYEIYAINKGYVNTADECNNSITRELAFHITWQILCSDDCRTPNQLITYELGEYTSEVPFTDKESVNMKYRDSIAELYKNAIVAGYTDKTLLPQNNITRAETAKTLCKCIERFGDDRQIDVIKSLFQAMERITTGESKNGTLGVDGGYAYAFEVNQTGLYPITLTGNVILTVYKNSGTDDNPTYTKCARKITGNNYYYPLYAGNKVYLAISGYNGTSYSLSIGYPTEGNRNRKNETKTIQIPLYDSPDITSFLQEYCNAHGYSIDNSATLRNRYLDSNGNKYEYTVDFFKNYLKALGNNNVVFSINIRDIYFDSNYINYGNGDNSEDIPDAKLDEWSAYITPKLISMIGTIALQIRNAYNSLISDGYTIPIPQICIGSAHFNGRYYGESFTDTQRNIFAEKYVSETEQLYNGVVNMLGDDSMIYGIYFGKEDPLSDNSFNVETDRFEKDTCYITMVKMAQFIQNKGKKHVWMPYTVGERNTLRRVGKVANSMMYLGTDNLYHDVFDIVIIQPGFFYKEIHSEEENTELAVMQYDTLKSIEENRVVIYNDDLSGYAPQNGAKLTDTVIGFQIEFDGGLYTGRQAGYDVEKNTSTPKKKAERFSKTVKVFYNALYNSSITFGMYPGGPNEQGFTSDIIAGNNNNKHSYKNHIAYKPDEIANNQYGDGKEYMNFWNALGGVYYNNSTTSYTGSLILDIIRGVSNNVWTENAQNYYSGLLNFSDDGKLLNY